MIQRIQSIFLFASLCFLAPMFFVTVADLAHLSGEVYAFNLTGFFQTTQTVNRQYSLMLFGVLICVVNLVAIFLYRNRSLQMRLCVYNIIFIAGLLGVMLFILLGVKQIETVSYHLPVVFPVISIILHYLAYRGIRKDELMVRALSRLR
jgi:hypothetical protein